MKKKLFNLFAICLCAIADNITQMIPPVSLK